MKRFSLLLAALFCTFGVMVSAVAFAAQPTAATPGVPRQSLLEFFSTERCTQCPQAHANIERLFADAGDSIILLCHHSGFYDDQFTIPVSVEYEWFYSPLRGTYAPAAMFDRTCDAQNYPDVFRDAVPVFDGALESRLRPAFRMASAVPAQAELSIDPQYVPASRQLTLSIMGHVLDGIDPSRQVYLNVFLSEDSVPTHKQAGTDLQQVYYQRHVARHCFTGMQGQAIPASGQFSQVYSLTLPAQWEASQVRAIAFVSYFDPTDRCRCQVLNAAQADIVPADADDIEDDPSLHHFYFDNAIVTPAHESTVSQLQLITIDYSSCAGTADGFNLGNGDGKGWVVGPGNTKHDVTLHDDYVNHLLTIRIAGDPLVQAGSYKLTIPEGAINVYLRPDYTCGAFSCRWTVDGSLDTDAGPRLKLVTSTPSEGEVLQGPVQSLSLTFDQDIAIRHSTFDAAGVITNLTAGGFIQLKTAVSGPVLTITRSPYSSSDFMEGQQFVLELKADRITSVADPSISAPAITIHFSIAADGQNTGDLKVMAQRPARGLNIRNAGNVEFNLPLTAVDSARISLVNEDGHMALFSAIGIDPEVPWSLQFNIADDVVLRPGTTYHLMIPAGAVIAEDGIVAGDLDAAYWTIPGQKEPVPDDPQPEAAIHQVVADAATLPAYRITGQRAHPAHAHGLLIVNGALRFVR